MRLFTSILSKEVFVLKSAPEKRDNTSNKTRSY
ncbi:hypothetical protein HHE014_11150 [Helicobacter heilmannii]|nr:hypothetical protein HHE014_11150 [Helicobacter heilmannii]